MGSNGSLHSSPSKKLSTTIQKRKFFEEGGERCRVIFAEDGMKAKDIDKTKSIKIDISQAVKRYKLPVP